MRTAEVWHPCCCPCRGETPHRVGVKLLKHVPQADDALDCSNQTQPSLRRVLRDLEDLIQHLQLELLELLLESG